MKHIYKQGGPYKQGNIEYSVRTVADKDLELFINKGWSTSLDKMPIEAEFEVVEKTVLIEQSSDDKQDLISKLKEHGVNAGSNWGIDTLKKKLSEMQNGNDIQG